MLHINQLHRMVKSNFTSEEKANSTPHYQPGTFLSSEEVLVYKALSNVFDANTKVFAKVWLAELVAAPMLDQHLRHWRRVQRRRLDYLVCSASTLRPIMAIKLENEADSKRRRKRGPDIAEEVLQDIGIPLLRLAAQDEYQAESLAKQINVTLKEGRQKRADTDVPTEKKAKTEIAAEAFNTAFRQTAALWSNAVFRFRERFFQMSRGTLK